MIEAFGQRLKRTRKGLKITQRELAKKAGITINHISGYERGRTNPNMATLEWLCKSLGVTATELLGF